ncbi:pectinesterase family protein [Listeria grayi]|nr:pectinesterase family protein [Listeria grayi]
MKETITVKKGGFLNKYRTIQQGINDVDEGGTVYIESGVYQERIILDGKNVTLVGQGNVTVTGEIDYPLITTIDTTLSLKGLTFIQKGHTNAVYIKENSKVKIDSCTIEGEDHKDVKTTYPALWVGLDKLFLFKIQH